MSIQVVAMIIAVAMRAFGRAFGPPVPPDSEPVIDLVMDDIARFRADAVVNAADRSLLGGTGVDGRLREAAGPGLSRACRNLGPVRTGECVFTSGYALPARYVIHVAAPVWTPVHSPEDLGECYSEALALAGRQGWRTVAFPLLGAGGFGWDSEDACEAAVTGIRLGLRGRAWIQVSIVLIDRRHFDRLETMLGVRGRIVDERVPYHPGMAFDEY